MPSGNRNSLNEYRAQAFAQSRSRSLRDFFTSNRNNRPSRTQPPILPPNDPNYPPMVAEVTVVQAAPIHAYVNSPRIVDAIDVTPMSEAQVQSLRYAEVRPERTRNRRNWSINSNQNNNSNGRTP